MRGFNITRERVWGDTKKERNLGTVFADNKVDVNKVRKNRKKLMLTMPEDIIRSNHTAHTHFLRGVSGARRVRGR